jgi:glycolate oxidase iron-sulfur subunit
MSKLGRWFRWLLPRPLAKQVPTRVGGPSLPTTNRSRKILLLNGCAQQVVTPDTNALLIQFLDKHDIGVISSASEQCCGSLDLHLGATDSAMTTIRANVDALIDKIHGVEAIVSTASGCGVTIKDYARLLQDDPQYGKRAQRIVDKTMDLSEYCAEYLADIDLSMAKLDGVDRVAWHSPCTLQHGQRVTGVVEGLLERAGYELTEVADAHLCCGSAGTYSVLQSQLAEQLKEQKLSALLVNAPDVIATANVGCQTHLGYKSQIPVMHWIELLS